MRLLLKALLLLAFFAAAYFTTERLVIYPLDPRLVSPADAGEPRLSETKFGKMVVWSAPAKRDKPTILYLHGNAGHLSNRVPRFQRLLDRGYGIVAPAYRGGSGSSGWPTEQAITEDIRNFYVALTEGKITETPVDPIIYGESIGAAVTIQLMASYGMDHGWRRPKAVVLEAPFTSIKDVAATLHPQLPLATGLMLSRWDSNSMAQSLTEPLLILHGAKDQLIPLSMGRAILAKASSTDKELYVVQDAGHINVWTGDAQRRLYRFLGRF